MAKSKVRNDKIASPVLASDSQPAAKKSRINVVSHSLPKLTQKSGNLLVCGQNDVGQLGLNPDDVMEKTRPAQVPEVTNIVDVKAGGMHSLALTKAGEIWSFGCNDEGALGRNTEEEGSETKPKKIELPGKVVKISAGDSHSACLLEDGRAFAWGSFRDAHGSMGLTTEGNKKSPVEVVPGLVAVDIASGNDHLVILARNGNVYTIGCAEQGQLGRITARTLTGESRRGTKTLLTPGMIPKKAGKFVANAIWATPFCTFLREQSTDLIFGFGLNNYNQLGVKKSGKEFEHFPMLSQFKNVKTIAGGQHHTIVLTADNKVHAIGRRDYGRLGLGEVKDDVETLTPVTGLQKLDIIEINCGDCNTFAITKDGKIYVWGLGTNSQLGTGAEDDVLEPTLLTGAQVKEKNVISVSSGGQHSLFIVEAPDTTTKAVKPKVVETPVEAAPKENGTAAPKPAAKNSKKAAPVIMESDSTTDVNGNSEKDEKMEVVDTTEAKRGRKRKV